jgi:hypothetical protein
MTTDMPAAPPPAVAGRSSVESSAAEPKEAMIDRHDDADGFRACG